MARPIKKEKLERVVLYLEPEIKNKIGSCDKTDLRNHIAGFFGKVNSEEKTVIEKAIAKSKKAPAQKKTTLCQTFFKQ